MNYQKVYLQNIPQKIYTTYRENCCIAERIALEPANVDIVPGFQLR